MLERPRIIDVERKPSKCPKCGERVVDIIYGTGDMTEIEFVMEYRRGGIMGGDNIPRRPPIWACSCGCKRFRKINPDGTDAPVKVKMLRDIRKRPASCINWETDMVSKNYGHPGMPVNHFDVVVTTELGEKETLNITAVNGDDAEDQARELVMLGYVGLKGTRCVSVEVYDK